MIRRSEGMMIWWQEGNSSFENIYRDIILKGSLFDIWKQYVSFYTRSVPANGLLQFQSPETEQAVVFLQPADMSAESRDQSPENDCVKFQRTGWSAEWVRQALSQQWCFSSQSWWFFVKAPMIWWLVTYRWYHQGHGAHASIEGGFFESKKAT